jgi:hypothetical protein
MRPQNMKHLKVSSQSFGAKWDGKSQQFEKQELNTRIHRL